jgi:hypothetical protein
MLNAAAVSPIQPKPLKLDIPFFEKKLTVSHLESILSFSNLANSRLSWMVVKIFHRSRSSIPIIIKMVATVTQLSIVNHATFHYTYQLQQWHQ